MPLSGSLGCILWLTEKSPALRKIPCVIDNQSHKLADVLNELLALPILYISEYINRNRREYYHLLRGVSAKNHWEECIRYMLTGFHLQAKATKETFAILIAFKNLLLYLLTRNVAGRVAQG